MKRWTRALLAAVLSAVLLLGPFASLAEVPPDAEPTVEITEAPEPEATDAPEPTEIPATDPPATDPPEVDPPAADPTETPEEDAPKAVEKLSFRKSEIEITLTEVAEGLEYAKLNALEVSPEGAKPGKIVWSVREEKDGRASNEVAAFVDYDKDGEKLEGDYAEEDIKETRFEVYKAGTAYIRAALKSDGDIYAEFKLVVVDDLPTDAPETEQPTDAPETEQPTEEPAPEATEELLVEELLPVEPTPIVTEEPTEAPETEQPTEIPTEIPTEEPTGEPTEEPLFGELPTDDPGLDQTPMFLSGMDDGSEMLGAEGVPAETISLSPAVLYLNVGGVGKLTATLDTAVAAPVVSWGSNNAGVTIDDAGNVTAVLPCEATIAASFEDINHETKSALAVVHVGAYPNDLSPAVGYVSAYALKPEGEQQLAVTSTNIPSPTVTWSTEPGDEGVATVSAAGLVTAVGPGTATITATSENGLTCDFTISVYSIKISPPAGFGKHAHPGQDLVFTVSTLPGGTVAWSSSDEAFATVSAGNVHAVAEGTTTLHAKLVDHEEIYDEYTLIVDDFGPGAGMQPSYILPIGETVDLEVAGEPSAPLWESGNPAVATVDQATGAVTAVKEGTTTVTATAGGLVVPFEITVASITLTPHENKTTVAAGATLQVTAAVVPNTLIPEWTSSDPTTATVDKATGLVAGVKAGPVTITAKIPGTSVSASIGLTVNVPATGITFTTSPAVTFDGTGKAELYSGTALDLTAVLAPEGSTDPLAWSFTPPAGIVATLSPDNKTLHVEATVDTNGLMIATDGTLLPISVTAGAVTENRVIAFRQSVTSVTVAGTDVVNDSLRLYSKPNAAGKGNSSLLTATVLPANAANKAVTWLSSDTGVATVDANGLVTAVTHGTTTISATSVTNGTVMDEVAVTVVDRAELITLDIGYKVADLYGDPVSYTITADLYPPTAEEVYWRSSDTAVATITPNGEQATVTCLTGGYAVFFAYTSKDDFDHPERTPTAPYAISLVKVVKHATELKLEIEKYPPVAGYPDLAVGIGQTIPLGVEVKPADATDPGYIITSGDPTVLQVSGANGLKGLRTGKVTVTVAASDAGSRITPKTLVVEVVGKGKGVTSLKLSKTSISVTVGSTGPAGGYSLTGSSSPSGAKYKGVRWYSADPTIATITSTKSATGYVKGVKPGETWLYGISTAGHVKSCKVVVKPLMPSGIKIKSGISTMYVGEKQQFSTSFSPSNVFDPTVNGKATAWRSSNSSVALVSDEGLVYAVSAGTTTIYAKTANEKVGSYKLTVKNNKCYNDSYDVRIVDNNDAMYEKGKYTLDYELFLNGATKSDKTIAQWAAAAGVDGLEGYDYVYYRPLQGLEIDYKILAYNATNTQLLWLSMKTSVAKIDKYSGQITGVKVGTAEIRAKSRLNSNNKQFDAESVTIEPKPGSGLTVYDGASSITALTLTYGEPARQLTTAPSGVAVGWESDNEQVAKVDSSGKVTAIGIGTATISAFPLGLKDTVTPAKVSVKVQRPDGSSEVKYRALVVGLYQTSGQSGYLPFGSNSTTLARSAIAKSSVDGGRYKITFRNNSQVKSPSSLQTAIDTAFAGAQEGDVSIIFLHSHGTVYKGEYRWHLYGSKYITGSQIIDSIKGVKGHVVLCVASCYSGNEATSNSIITRAKNEDARRFRDLGPLNSLSIITSTDGKNRSGYLNTASSIAVDFFSVGFNRALNGKLTVPEMFSRIKSGTKDAVDDYKKLYGAYSQVGTNTVVDQNWSPRAKDVIVFNNT